MRFLGHSTVRIEIAGRVVLTDPVLGAKVGPLSRVAAPLDPAAWAGVDLVLISHLHGDHLHLPSLRLLGPQVRVVVPAGAGEWLRRRGVRRVEELSPGEELVDGELRITATYAAHSGHRWGPRFTHGPHAPAIGHLLRAPGSAGSGVYFAGDTDLFPAMADLAGAVDVALLPVWGWGPSLGPGHLDPHRAAQAVDLVKPGLAVPVHWGTLALPGLARGRRMRRLLVEPPRVFADEVAAHGSPTDVVVVRPGHEIPLGAGSEAR
ncbi:MBL fold metallo-hydrolase [Amycolatopsis nigrescens]|uniref:MBL fold metallo-hydrolase n=1 Tax=Amycolatopsis nigrescens TaxID=381445 RepID=UPI00037A815F